MFNSLLNLLLSLLSLGTSFNASADSNGADVGFGAHRD
jgi:hypothetical protein